MENKIIKLYKEKVDRSHKIAFISTFVIGLLVHMYKFSNTLLNYDSLYNYYSDQNVIGSGRWFLSIACGLSSYYDLPWVNGILSIFFIALTAVFVIDIFDVKNTLSVMIISGLLVTFPSVTTIFFYGFTADGYMMAMLFAAISSWLIKVRKTKISHIFISSILLCLSCAIYQAFVSFAMVLSLSYFICALLDNKHTVKEYLKYIRNQLIIYASAMISYYVIWKICLYFQQADVNSYMGIHEAGNINIGNIKSQILLIPRKLFDFFLPMNSFQNGCSPWTILNIIFLCFLFFILVQSIIKSKIYRSKLRTVLLIMSGVSMPYIIYIWEFVTPYGVSYGVRMLQSVCILIVLMVVLSQKWLCLDLAFVTKVLLVTMIVNNSISTNICYFYMNRCNQQTYASAVEISNEIHDLDRGQITKVAFFGSLNNWYEWSTDGFFYSKLEKILPFDKCTRNRNLLDGSTSPDYFLHELGFMLSYYKVTENNPDEIGFAVADSEERKTIQETSEFDNMPCWPAADSIQVFGDTVVVKLSD